MSHDKAFTITWKIVNYSFNTLKGEESIKSPVFQVKNLKGTKWYLSLYPKSYENSPFVTCFLNRDVADDLEGVIEISWKLGVAGLNDVVLNPRIIEYKQIDKGQAVGKRILSVNQLTDRMKSWKEDTLSVHCEVSSHPYYTQGRQEMLFESRTVIPVQKCSFSWNLQISDILDWTKTIDVPFQNKPRFVINTTASNERIYVEIKKSNTLFDFLMKALSKLKVDKIVNLFFLSEFYKLELLILNDEGVKMNLGNHIFSFKTLDGIPLLKFETSIGRKRISYQSDITLLCSISHSSGVLTSAVESLFFGKPFQHLAAPSLSLKEDIKKMRSAKKYCDVNLRANGDIVSAAHKCILHARSTLLSAMLESDLLENRTGIVDIPDVESETLESFLDFLYTDDAPTFVTSDSILKLLLMADKYEVNMLKEQCVELLISKFSERNICEVISVAEMINHLYLKTAALDYIKINKNEILSGPYWPYWQEQNTKLANDILSTILLD